MIDPDIDHNDRVGTKERPLAHWLVMNIPDGMVESGDVVLSYRGSMPPAGTWHRYQFLLYKQNGTLDVNPKDYAPDCQVASISDRLVNIFYMLLTRGGRVCSLGLHSHVVHTAFDVVFVIYMFLLSFNFV